MSMMVAAEALAIADGPTEVHKITLATQLLKEYKPADGLWPTAHIPSRRDEARARYAELLERQVAEF